MVVLEVVVAAVAKANRWLVRTVRRRFIFILCDGWIYIYIHQFVRGGGWIDGWIWIDGWSDEWIDGSIIDREQSRG